MSKILNWKQVKPFLSHNLKVWQILENNKNNSHQAGTNCLKKIKFVCRAMVKKNTESINHSHDDNEEIIIIIKGEGTAIIGNKKFNIKKGDLIYIEPKESHVLKADKNESISFFAFGADV